MQPDVARDLGDSARAFRDLVWPAVARWCGGGEIVPMEGVADSRFARSVDTLSGVDAWQLCPDRGAMRGIASRVQFGAKAWPSFTLRERRASGAETELAKRLAALADPRRCWLLPALTVHGYVSARRDGRLLYAAVAYTHELCGLVRDGTPGQDYERRTVHSDGNVFVVVWVERLRALGLRVRAVDER